MGSLPFQSFCGKENESITYFKLYQVDVLLFAGPLVQRTSGGEEAGGVPKSSIL